MIVRWIAIALVWTFIHIFYRHKNYGRKHFPKGGGLVASNHCSFWDPPIIGVSAPDAIHFLARETLFRSKIFGWILKQLKTHPVHRGKGNAYIFRKAIELIEGGEKVVIFPEGRRSPDGTLHKGQSGIGILVQRTRCKVVPVYVHGTYAIWNSKRKFPKLSGKTACVFGKPLDFSHQLAADKREEQQEITDIIMAKIAELRDWYLAGAKGTPP